MLRRRCWLAHMVGWEGGLKICVLSRRYLARLTKPICLQLGAAEDGVSSLPLCQVALWSGSISSISAKLDHRWEAPRAGYGMCSWFQQARSSGHKGGGDKRLHASWKTLTLEFGNHSAFAGLLAEQFLVVSIYLVHTILVFASHVDANGLSLIGARSICVLR